jgi:hypothetical protein
MKEGNILTISSRPVLLQGVLQKPSRSVILTEPLQTKILLTAPKLSLPGELWLYVCDTLGPSDRKALAQACQAFWTLINAKAPFLTQLIEEDDIINLSPSLLALRLSFLASATELRWLTYRQQSFLSSNPLTIDVAIPGSILRTISESTALQSLELTGVEISPEHQHVILRIPTLRKLTLCDSIWVPTTETLPPTSIHVLVLRSLRCGQTASGHLFRILADSLETLELGTRCIETDVNKLYSTLGSMRLQRFTSIRVAMPVLLKNLNHSFLYNSFITVLHVNT